MDAAHYTRGSTHDTDDPPQSEIEEIHQRIAQVKAGWSQKETNKRGNGCGRVPWKIPVYRVEYVAGQPHKLRRQKRTKIYVRVE